MVKVLMSGLEWLLIGVLLFVAYSQLVRPLIKKTPVFPFFRRRPNIEREIETANEELEEKALRGELESQKSKLDN